MASSAVSVHAVAVAVSSCTVPVTIVHGSVTSAMVGVATTFGMAMPDAVSTT